MNGLSTEDQAAPCIPSGCGCVPRFAPSCGTLSAKREMSSPLENVSDVCHSLYNFYFVYQHQINNKRREKAGPSRAVTLKLNEVSTLFREINNENRKTMMYDDISSLLQESIVRWHKMHIISLT